MIVPSARAGPRSTSPPERCRHPGAFQFYNINSYETVERMIRRGVYKGPLVMNWVAIGGGMDAPNIYNLANFVRHPDGAMLTLESSMLNVLPVNMMAIAMGLRALRHRGQPLDAGPQGQDELGEADRAAGAHLARVRSPGGDRQGGAQILKIGTFYNSIDETLAKNGFAPNRTAQRGFLKAA